MLHDSVSSGNRSEVQSLLEAGASVDERDGLGGTALHYARHPQVAQMLIDSDADPNAVDLEGNTPLHMAAGADRPSVVRLLLLSGASPAAVNNLGETPLHLATERMTIEFLLRAGVDVNAVDARGETALVRSVDRGDKITASVLLQAGADPNIGGINGLPSLHLAVKRKAPGIVSNLLECGARVGKPGKGRRTAMHLAADVDSVPIAELLLAAGADAAAADRSGRTPLHVATSPAMVGLLCSRGASPAATDRKGETPLMAAVKQSWAAAVAALIEAGSDVNAADLTTRSPLHEALSDEIANLLIKNGADIEAQDEAGNTPLIAATRRADMGVIESLVKAGASLEHAAKDGLTALQLARAGGSTQLLSPFVVRDRPAKPGLGGVPDAEVRRVNPEMLDASLSLLRNSILTGKARIAREAVLSAFECGAMYENLAASVSEAISNVGAKYRNNEYYAPEVMIAARAAMVAHETMRDLAMVPDRHNGCVVIGMAGGDHHFVGKQIVSLLLSARGFRVVDLDVSSTPMQFASAAMEESADVVAVSAGMSTTAPIILKILQALETFGVRDKVKVIVGGGAVTQAIADEYGADAYGYDATDGIRIVESWMTESRA